MPDDSISSSGSSDVASSNTELPMPVATLSVDGIAPDMGDPVTFKVSGSVTRVVNGVAYVKAETVNDQPMPGPVIEPDGSSEMDRLERLSREISLP